MLRFVGSGRKVAESLLARHSLGLRATMHSTIAKASAPQGMIYSRSSVILPSSFVFPARRQIRASTQFSLAQNSCCNRSFSSTRCCASATSVEETDQNEAASSASPEPLEAAAAPSGTDASPSVDKLAQAEASHNEVRELWNKEWSAFVELLLKQNYEETVTLSREDNEQLDDNMATIKRSMLGLARSRRDILYSLPEDKVIALVEAGSPFRDRKVRKCPDQLHACF